MNVPRRMILASVGGSGVASLAGCLGGSGGGNGEFEPPVAGDPDADVTVAVYEDFGCPSCATFKQSIYPQVRDSFIDTEEIRYEHHDFPNPTDESWSWPVANAARAVYESEGAETFWAFSDAIYEHIGAYSYDVIESVATDVGADGDAVREAAESESYQSTIEASRSAAESRGVGGTPSVFVDDEEIDPNDTILAINTALE